MSSRPRVVTDKAITLSALAAEMGGAGLCSGPHGSRTVVTAADGSPVTQQQLEAAVEAHDPAPHQQSMAQDAADGEGLRGRRVHDAVGKARAIRDDPQGSPDWTPAERKMILAYALLDLARRHR